VPHTYQPLTDYSVKVFDFGLSKEIHPSMAVGDGTYKLTGYTGSIRYMAPEIAREEPCEFCFVFVPKLA